MYKTRNGALCLPTGKRRTSDGKALSMEAKSEVLTYLECQMLPLDTYRMEWVREDNLTAVVDKS